MDMSLPVIDGWEAARRMKEVAKFRQRQGGILEARGEVPGALAAYEEAFRVNPTDPRPFVLPRTFAFMGQRFILDSWALSKIVYDDIVWTAFDPKVGQDVTKKIQRRIPSSETV